MASRSQVTRLRHGVWARLVARSAILTILSTLAPTSSHASLSSAGEGESALPRLAPALPDQPPPVLVWVVTAFTYEAEAGALSDGYTYSAFGELLAHTGADPQPYAFAGEPLDPNSGWQYHRARWMDPSLGIFAGMDPWEGSRFDPATLHRYLYAGLEPVGGADPTGRFNLPQRIATLSISVTVAISNFGAQLVPAFARGGPVVGRLFVRMGRYAQGIGREVIRYYTQLRPGTVRIAENVRTSGQTVARRVVDFYVKVGDLGAWIEVKYGLPYRVGPAMTRLVGQMRAALAEKTGQVVLWTLRYPTTAQVRLLERQLGADYARVQIVSGAEGLYRWMVFYFGHV